MPGPARRKVRWNRAVETLDLVWGRGALAAGIEGLFFGKIDRSGDKWFREKWCVRGER